MSGEWTALDIIRQMMTKTDRVPLIYGSTTTTPISFQEDALEYKITGAINSEGVYEYFEKGGRYPTRQELITKGATINFDFHDSEGPIPSYFFIGVPRGFDLVCFGIFQGGHFIEFDEGWIREPESYDYVIGGTNYRYDFYRLLYPTVGKFTVRFAFMDAFDPRVHPALRHPGRKMNLADLWKFLHNAFQTDDNGELILSSEGVPLIRPESIQNEEAKEIYATWEALNSEGLARQAMDQILREELTDVIFSDKELQDWKKKYWPDNFNTGREDQPDEHWLPDTVIVGEQYVLKATVKNSRGDVYYRWDRDTGGSEGDCGCDCCDIINTVRLDGKTIVLNSEGEWSTDIMGVLDKVLEKLPELVDQKTITTDSEGLISLKTIDTEILEIHQSSIVDPVYGEIYYLELPLEPELLYENVNDNGKYIIKASYEYQGKMVEFKTAITSAYKEKDLDGNILIYRFYDGIHSDPWQCGEDSLESSDMPRLYL